ncbi:uncharacterized protein BO97DRAFT_179537 [Aspergillus homomorphus CBS 101889]|uniref:Uncharacterized protein n=1 Tax=Aspergillus homomorphus (strain CBS 101889) TaxID=1450537 RepID=A0A395I744_ASPHC|nr:hypothetical protein BO97DRAFT_179537 [Aspergillus homomorphus CBS 101889]RAL16032.1 hypothetical protein BO97DRAFT_179537 [Aspergillus homomorphus CBS 101889]
MTELVVFAGTRLNCVLSRDQVQACVPQNPWSRPRRSRRNWSTALKWVSKCSSPLLCRLLQLPHSPNRI